MSTQSQIHSTQPKKKKYSLATGKMKLGDQDYAEKVKWKHKYNTTVKVQAEFKKLKERVS